MYYINGKFEFNQMSQNFQIMGSGKEGVLKTKPDKRQTLPN